ncbi:MAG TPA: MJ0042-type zinc finger domain-containing protein [Pyrinomonadaceae bacterium]|nr:MJ0042-type zinc finger domain-containing protein [Pyrinomonadaceae bacterium]
MIISCPHCTTRLQVDEEKSPPPFTIRCPKCGQTINSSAPHPAAEQSALAVGSSPSTERVRYEHAKAAPAYEVAGSAKNIRAADSTSEVMRLLADLLSKGQKIGVDSPHALTSWQQRKALVCTSEIHREPIARGLTESGCQVFVAGDCRQALERMRGNDLQLVLLDPQFDAGEQGAAFVVREINVLRPNQRRRIFFVLISPTLRTMDAHAAFLNHVNAVVNVNDLEELPRILEIALRDFNDLYKEFNLAFNLAAL